MKKNEKTTGVRPVGMNPRVWDVLKKVAAELWKEHDRGISTRKSKELRHQWHERRRTAHRYLDAGVKDGVFLDKFDFVIDTSDISTRFNGFEIMPDT